MIHIDTDHCNREVQCIVQRHSRAVYRVLRRCSIREYDKEASQLSLMPGIRHEQGRVDSLSCRIITA